MPKFRLDLTCFDCGAQEAEYLFFWKRYQKEDGSFVIYGVRIICAECVKKFQASWKLFADRPYFISFKRIGKMNPQSIGWLLSHKKWAANYLNCD